VTWRHLCRAFCVQEFLQRVHRHLGAAHHPHGCGSAAETTLPPYSKLAGAVIWLTLSGSGGGHLDDDLLSPQPHTSISVG
jgi:hypothetical protein